MLLLFEVGMLTFILASMRVYPGCERCGGEVAKYEALAVFGDKNAHNIAIVVKMWIGALKTTHIGTKSARIVLIPPKIIENTLFPYLNG